MIILRQQNFSLGFGISKKIGERLEKEHYQDFDISTRIPNDSISITANLGSVEIYIPEEFEYSQYEIDDFLRNLVPFIRTSIDQDRNMYIMTLSKPLTEDQYFKLVKYIIDANEFCVIIDK